MKRHELLLGAALYGLVIAAGYSSPVLKKLEALSWNEPVRVFAKDFFQSLADGGQPVPKALLTAKVRRVSLSGRQAKGESPLEAAHRKREENWKRMASSPGLRPEAGPSPAARSFAGKKSGFPPTPAPSEKKAFDDEYPTKG